MSLEEIAAFVDARREAGRRPYRSMAGVSTLIGYLSGIGLVTKLPPPGAGNACLTCPDFQTTPQFLPLHRRQRDDTLVLLTAAEQAGNTRLVANHRQVVDNLGNVIDTLETIEQESADAR